MFAASYVKQPRLLVNKNKKPPQNSDENQKAIDYSAIKLKPTTTQTAKIEASKFDKPDLKAVPVVVKKEEPPAPPSPKKVTPPPPAPKVEEKKVEEPKVEEPVEVEEAPKSPVKDLEEFYKKQVLQEQQPQSEEAKALIEAQLAQRKEEARKRAEARAKEAEKRKEKLEKKLMNNKAVAVGQSLFVKDDKGNTINRPEHELMMDESVKRHNDLEERTRAANEKHSAAAAQMNAKIAPLAAECEMAQEYMDAKAAEIEAEKERVKQEKIAKKLEDEKKWAEYERRKEQRKSIKE